MGSQPGAFGKESPNFACHRVSPLAGEAPQGAHLSAAENPFLGIENPFFFFFFESWGQPDDVLAWL